jgi:hypothetical protein
LQDVEADLDEIKSAIDERGMPLLQGIQAAKTADNKRFCGIESDGLFEHPNKTMGKSFVLSIVQMFF